MIITPLRLIPWVVAALLLCSLSPASVFANGTDPDGAALEAFVDGFMSREMEENHVPGAVVSIVKDGNVALLKGYGYADLDRRIPADPRRSVFRLGSLAKTVTATAVMQLAEEGRLDLKEDIKRYVPELGLDYKGGEPVTLHHLLTHTAGFCESVFAVGRDPEEQMPLADALRSYFPELCRKPGEQTAYSNQGMSLAGYIVEKAAGKPYPEVVQERIFEPLRMKHSGFRLQASDPELALSYAYSGGQYAALPYSYIHHLPAGALLSTAEDMSRYMLAHLQLGRYGEGRILTEETVRKMHSTQYTLHKNMPGMAYGFYEGYRNGLRLIEHDGGIDGFESYMYLIPSQGTGIFIGTNSGGGALVRERLIEDYLDRFHPYLQRGEAVGKPSAPLKELERLEGYYIPNRAKLQGPLNLAQHLSAVRLEAVGDGEITFGGKQYTAANGGPGFFRQDGGGERRWGRETLYIDADSALLVRSSIPTMVYERQTAAWYHPYVHLGLILGFVLLYPLHALAAVLRWLNGLARRKRCSPDWYGAAVSVLFTIYFLFVVSTPELFINSIPWWSRLALGSPFLLLAALILRLVIRRRIRNRPNTGFQVAMAAATAVFVGYLAYMDFFSL